MKKSGDILLVACYELGHQPLHLASPLGFLSQAGYKATGIDASIEEIPKLRVAQAKFIGIAVPMHTAMRIGVEIAGKIRKLNPDVHLCFYGLYATLNAEYLLSSIADSVIGGEYEQPLLDLILALETNDPEPPPGVRIRHHTAAPHLQRQRFFPPNRRLLPSLNRYAHLNTGYKTVMAGYVEASRGCLHTCLHCPITPVYNGRFFVIPVNVVLDDIRQLVEMGAEHITFGDPDFFNGPGHSMKIVRALHDAFPNVTFDITTKVEHVLRHSPVFGELRTLGCAFVVSAIESVSNSVLERLEKGHTRMDIHRALEILEGAGIPMRPSLVSFTPWTTMDDYRDMLVFINSHGLIDHIDPIQYTIRLLIPPGSALLARSETHTWLGSLDQETFTYRWVHPDPRMDTLYHKISRLVKDADYAKEDPRITFSRIASHVCTITGDRPSPPFPSPTPPTRRHIPKLTESWFC